jgi:hypothetical protein
MNDFILLIAIILFTIVAAEFATIVFHLTGLDRKTSLFQAISALTGTGFTTKQSETIMAHPLRRKVIITLMLIGRGGGIIVIASLISKVGKDLLSVQVLSIFLIFIIAIYILRKLNIAQLFSKLIEKGIIKIKLVEKSSFDQILELAKNYGIAEIYVTQDTRWVDKRIQDLDFRKNDILIIAIKREEKILPTPKASTRLENNDILTCYGKLSSMKQLSRQ